MARMGIWKIWLIFNAMCLPSTTQVKDACSECVCMKDTIYCFLNTWNIMPSLINLPDSITDCRLDNNHIKHVKQFPRANITYLSLARCNIETIDDAAFQNLRNLTTLDLSFNRLNAGKLVGHIFRGNYAPDKYEPLWSLKSLTLRKNLLLSLNSEVFEHVPQLESLDLSQNPLEMLDGSTEKALASLLHLKELNLSDTIIKHVPNSFVHVWRSLETLDLSRNRFNEASMGLEHMHNLLWLALDRNPINAIRRFPQLRRLRVLHLNHMEFLTEISSRSLSVLPNLEEFRCSHNNELRVIDGSTFSSLDTVGEGEVWPPLRTLLLNNNSLRYLERHLVSNWQNLNTLDLQNNPWACDCENQWIIETLVPLISSTNEEYLKSLKCQQPIEMRGRLFDDMYQQRYNMRCLDVYNHKPEKDASLLIGILFGLMFCMPIVAALVLCYNRLLKNDYRNRYVLFSNADEFSL